ncbi:hypothetical protein [Nostoc sp. WHI]|uniref:hypothetical protein n=1 Tax=Nostoc sp. WHI TaxID=2650611 RepID=UPI0018C7807B|nr:hypothetical protein [Nostoc sp. WHI]MBG1271194.1 hypothetical protein [Nostoc sp. WHI]
MQHLCSYLYRLPYAMMENFELWGIYEADFSEAVISFLAFQLLEDAIAHLINLSKRREPVWISFMQSLGL